MSQLCLLNSTRGKFATRFLVSAEENLTQSLRKKCPYSELFWSVFSRIRTRITPNTDTFHAANVTDIIISCNKFEKISGIDF